MRQSKFMLIAGLSEEVYKAVTCSRTDSLLIVSKEHVHPVLKVQFDKGRVYIQFYQRAYLYDIVDRFKAAGFRVIYSVVE